MRVKYPPPLVPRRLRLEVAERVRFDGSVETPLDEAAVQSAAKRFKELGVAAVAVCFLHAYANPAHEARATQILRDAAPELFVSASADVFPNMREFERWTTTTVNAFTQPMFDRYLERLEKGLASRGFRGRLYIMASSGGTLTAEGCTLSGNSTAGPINANAGGGIYASSFCTLDLSNTLVAGNTAATAGPDISGIVNSGSNNLVGNGTGMSGLTNGSNGNQVGVANATTFLA